MAHILCRMKFLWEAIARLQASRRPRALVFGQWIPGVLVLVFGLLFTAPVAAQQRLRVIVETDIGGDADDQASLVRFLLYANEWDVEGIIADRHASKFHVDPVRDHKGIKANDGYELALAYIDAYGAVYENLTRHATGYPKPEHLRRLTVPGFDETDAGVNLIISAGEREDPRPIWYANWGSNSGSTSNLRRAFDRIKRERSPAMYAAFVRKFRICTLDGGRGTRQGHEDLITLHIEAGYPDLGGRWYHRFRPLTERAGGFDVRSDVQQNHGPLGALYTTPKEGDSWTFVYLIPNGLSDPEQPGWGGWAGRYGPRGKPYDHRFYWANLQDTWKGQTSRDNTAARFAAHLQNDFKARMDWCVARSPKDSNHPPVPHCQGDGTRSILRVAAPAGKSLSLSATGSSDPDGDELTYHWYVYPEPGSYDGSVSIEKGNTSEAILHVPGDSGAKSIHVILEVTDGGTPPLTRYRRLIVTGN